MVQRQYLNNGKVQCLTQMQEVGPYQRTEDASPLNQELNDSLEQCVKLSTRGDLSKLGILYNFLLTYGVKELKEFP